MNFETNDEEIRCFFGENLNTTLCAEMETPLKDALNQSLKENPGRRIVFDLKDVHFVSSAFLRLCLFIFKVYGNSELRVEHASGDIKKVFAVAGLSHVFEVV